jgi:hypothetical protein
MARLHDIGAFGRRNGRSTMTDTYLATALVSEHTIGVTIRAENIGTPSKSRYTTFRNATLDPK